MFLFVDALVLGLAFALARAGWRRGFASFAIDLVGFTTAVVLALRFHGPLSVLYRWAVSPGWAALLGGLTIFVPVIVAVAIFGGRVGRIMFKPGLRSTDRVLGVGFGVALAASIVTFGLFVATAAPVPFGMAQAVRRSPSARLLLDLAEPVSGVLQRVAERDGTKWVLYLRQLLRAPDEPPQEVIDEPPPLRFDPADSGELEVDTAAERELFRMVNDERRRRELSPLAWDDRLASVGRAHSRDMYLRGEFAHRGADGRSPGDRLRDAGIVYSRSAENIALAPAVTIAHDGLMRSPGHRRNILDPQLRNLGIGIVSGPDGLMVSQEFCGGCPGR